MIFSLCISNKKIFLHIKPSSYCEDIESKRENTPFNHHYTHTHTHCSHSLLLDFSKFLFILLSPEYFFFHSIFTIPGAINQIHQPLCVRRALTTDCMSERESERGVGYSHIHNISFSYVCIKQNVSASYEQNSNNEHNEEKKFFSSMDSCLFFCSLQKKLKLCCSAAITRAAVACFLGCHISEKIKIVLFRPGLSLLPFF